MATPIKYTVVPGERIGFLTAIREVPFLSSHCRGVECVCDCGVTVAVPLKRFKNGTTKSCGHIKRWNAWKGGRHQDKRGYVTVSVGVGHPMADKHGRAYGHRLIAAAAAGRSLSSDEIVHHIDETKSGNYSDNLHLTDRKTHPSFHRRVVRAPGRELRMPGEDNPAINCACGCGQTLLRFDRGGRPRFYIHGHYNRLQHLRAIGGLDRQEVA